MPAPATKPTASGNSTRLNSAWSTATYSAKPPQVRMPGMTGWSQRCAKSERHQSQVPSPPLNGTMTRVPGRSVSTSAPTASTTPQSS